MASSNTSLCWTREGADGGTDSRVARRRLFTYGCLIAALVGVYIPSSLSAWKGSTELHTIMEAVGTLLAAITGTIALVRFYARKNNHLLYIGTAFLGTALLDGYHGVVTSALFHAVLPSPPPSLIPWSWNASRTFLAVVMCVSWWTWRWEHKLGPRAQHKEVVVYVVVGAMTIASFLFFAFVSLPRAYYPELIFGRPEEFVAAALFAIALVGYITKGMWRSDAFDHWTVYFLILSVFSQAVVMSRSYGLFDAMFDLAHLLKVLSYMCVLVGLLANMSTLFHKLETNASQLEETNLNLRQSMAHREVAERELLAVHARMEERTIELEMSRTAAINMMRDAEDARQVSEKAKHDLAGSLDTTQDAIDRQAEAIKQLESAQDQIQEKERRYRGILENVVDAVINIDERGIITNFNPAAERMFGYEVGEVLGKNVSLLMPSPYQEKHDGYLARYLKTGEKQIIGVSREVAGERKDGIAFPIQLSVSEVSLHSNDRTKTHRVFTGIIRDLTQEKRSEAELIRAMEAAETANRSKSEFLANMSHEIRTPMTAILGFSEVVLGNVSDPKDIDALDTIKRNGEYLLGIINDILDISKIESGKLEVEQVECSPCQILSEVASLMRVRSSAKGLSLEVEFDDPIPQFIQSDPTRLRQILINLTGNAVKFTEVGSVRLIARLLGADSNEPKMQFDVVDTGIGLSEEQVGKLFQPFVQADTSTTRKFGGSGLGLTISKRLAEMLGGDIRIQSVPGEGSTFSVTVSTGPLKGVKMVDGPAEAEAAIEQAAKPAAEEVRLDCRVLLAEDGPDNQRLISFVLKKAGADVCVAENGQIALDLALAAHEEENPFDVILMDMQMPVLDGYQATGKLRETGYTGPIIALTAHAMNSDRGKCLDAGCDDYATKPIDRKKLISLIAQCAGRPRTDDVLPVQG